MNAKIQNISEINKQCADKNTLSTIVVRLFSTFNLKSIIKSIGLEKPNGRPVCALLQNLILFRLYGESIFRSLVSGKGSDCFGKDCYYRLYKDSQIDWECRQYLRFGEYQGTDFDGMIADVTLTFLTHTMLTLEKRFQSYETFGEIFRETQTGLLESSLWERIRPMIYRLIELLSDITGLSVNEIMDMILRDEEKAEIYAELCNLIERQRSA